MAIASSHVAICVCGFRGPPGTQCACGQLLNQGNPNVRIMAVQPQNIQMMPAQQQAPVPQVVHCYSCGTTGQAGSQCMCGNILMSMPQSPSPQSHPTKGAGKGKGSAYDFHNSLTGAWLNKRHNQSSYQYQPRQSSRTRRSDHSRVRCVSCPYMKKVNHHAQCWVCFSNGVPIPNNANPQTQNHAQHRSAPPSPVYRPLEQWEQDLQVAAETLGPVTSVIAMDSDAMDVDPVASSVPDAQRRSQSPSPAAQTWKRDRENQSQNRSASRSTSRPRSQSSLSATEPMRRTPPTSPYPRSTWAQSPFDGMIPSAQPDPTFSRSPSPMPFQNPVQTQSQHMFGQDAQHVKEQAKILFENTKKLDFPSMTHGGFEYEKQKIYVPKQLTPKMRQQADWICGVCGIKHLDLSQLDPAMTDDPQKLQQYMFAIGNSFTDLEIMSSLAVYVKSMLAKHIRQVKTHLDGIHKANQAKFAAAPPTPPMPQSPTQAVIDMLSAHSNTVPQETRDILMNAMKLLQEVKSEQYIAANRSPPTPITVRSDTQLPSPNVQAATSMPSSFAASLRGTPNQNAINPFAENQQAINTKIDSDSSELSPVPERSGLNVSMDSIDSNNTIVPYPEDMENVYSKIQGGDQRNALVKQAQDAWGSNEDVSMPTPVMPPQSLAPHQPVISEGIQPIISEGIQSVISEGIEYTQETPALTREQWDKIATESRNSMDELPNSPLAKRAKKERSKQKNLEREKRQSTKGQDSKAAPAPKNKQSKNSKRTNR